MGTLIVSRDKNGEATNAFYNNRKLKCFGPGRFEMSREKASPIRIEPGHSGIAIGFATSADRLEVDHKVRLATIISIEIIKPAEYRIELSFAQGLKNISCATCAHYESVALKIISRLTDKLFSQGILESSESFGDSGLIGHSLRFGLTGPQTFGEIFERIDKLEVVIFTAYAFIADRVDYTIDQQLASYPLPDISLIIQGAHTHTHGSPVASATESGKGGSDNG